MSQNYFFTADWHFGHANIIKHCNRPFADKQEHDEILIQNINKKLKKGDILYFLGDAGMNRNYDELAPILKRINGQKHIILGNHDDEKTFTNLKRDGIIHDVKQVKGIKIDEQYIWLSHYPHRRWKNSFHGSWHFYGHEHGTLDDYGLSTDVGVDCWNFEPVSWEELKAYFQNKIKI